MAIKTDQIVLLKGGSRTVALIESGQDGELLFNGVEYDPVVRAADIDSGDATVGQVLTADGDGGVSFEDAAGGGGGLPTLALIAFMEAIDSVYDPPTITVVANTFPGLADEDVTIAFDSADTFVITVLGETFTNTSHNIQARTLTGRPVVCSGGGDDIQVSLLKYDGTALAPTDAVIRVHILVTKASA